MIAADLIREIESGPATDRLEYLADQITIALNALDDGPDVRALVLDALKADRPDCGWTAAWKLARYYGLDVGVSKSPTSFDANGYYVAGLRGEAFGARGKCHAHAILSVIARSRLLSAV